MPGWRSSRGDAQPPFDDVRNTLSGVVAQIGPSGVLLDAVDKAKIGERLDLAW